MSWRRVFLLLPVWVALLACAPALNWREISWLDGSHWWFPCKPERFERELTLADSQVPASMLVCDAQGATWAATAFQFAGPAQAAAALAPARMGLLMNMKAEPLAAPLLAGPGDGTARLWLTGQRPGGQPVLAVVRFQVRGAWLVQQVLMTAPVVGAGGSWPSALNTQALEAFFDAAMPGS